MENNNDFFNSFKNDILDYLQVRLDILRLEVYEKTSLVMASLFSSIIFAVLLFFMLFFVMMGLGFYLSELLNSNAKGFAIVAVLNLLFVVLFMLLRKGVIEKNIANSILKQLSDEEQHSKI
jgi:hypothetical protein